MAGPILYSRINKLSPIAAIGQLLLTAVCRQIMLLNILGEKSKRLDRQQPAIFGLAVIHKTFRVKISNLRI
jgi:hypothetical protein